jgi:replicative DNA helicase
MKMPNNEQSIVSEDKILGYLLNDNHEIGKHKAAFFKRFGFNITDIDLFRASLILHSYEREIDQVKDSHFGTKYELKCKINTPDKRNPCIVTVWIVENAGDIPRLVTAYPFA